MTNNITYAVNELYSRLADQFLVILG